MSGEKGVEEERCGRGLYTSLEDGPWLRMLLVDALYGEHIIGDLIARLRNKF